jgi:RNA polymerase sigma factor (sigma-70 family)
MADTTDLGFSPKYLARTTLAGRRLGIIMTAAASTIEQFISAESDALTGFAFQVTGCHEDALDAVQDALLGIFPRWDRVRAGGNPAAYLRRSIVNWQINQWHRKRRQYSLAWTDIARPIPDQPDERMIWVEQIQQLVAGLPNRQRTAVVLRYVEDRSFEDIGTLCGCTPATARSLAARGIARIRAQLANPPDLALAG